MEKNTKELVEENNALLLEICNLLKEICRKQDISNDYLRKITLNYR